MLLVIDGSLTDLNSYINAERSNKYDASKIKKDETEYVRVLAERSGIRPVTKPVYMAYYWYCENKRKDKSNIAFARKFIEDGLVEAGILKNDGWNDITGFSDFFFIDKDNPRVEVIITEVL